MASEDPGEGRGEGYGGNGGGGAVRGYLLCLDLEDKGRLRTGVKTRSGQSLGGVALCLPSADDPREVVQAVTPGRVVQAAPDPEWSACQEDVLGVLFLPHNWVHDLKQCLPLHGDSFSPPKWTEVWEPEAQGVTRPASGLCPPLRGD